MPPHGPWRKRNGAGDPTWHRCKNCSEWPLTDYEERYSKPLAGRECEQCKAKAAEGRCS
jgi:hypothetical protein